MSWRVKTSSPCKFFALYCLIKNRVKKVQKKMFSNGAFNGRKPFDELNKNGMFSLPIKNAEKYEF